MTASSGRPLWALAVVVAASLAARVAVATPHGEGGLVGARKLAQVHDCRGVVAFSGVGARPSVRGAAGGEGGPDGAEREQDASELGTKLGFRDLLTDKSVGWSRESGEFISVCPGLYQFAFSAAAPGARLSLRKKEAGSSSSWKGVASTTGGGGHVLLLEMDVGDVAAVWLTHGELPPEGGDEEAREGPRSSFSGYRIAKK